MTGRELVEAILRRRVRACITGRAHVFGARCPVCGHAPKKVS